MNIFPRLERVAELHRHRVAALTVAIVAALLLMVLTDVVAHMSWFGLAATVVAAAILFGDSDSFAGLGILGAMVLQWVTSGMASDSWWVIPAAWLLLVAHAAVALATSGPDQAPIHRALLGVWVPRVVLVGLATTVVGALTLVVAPTNDQRLPYGVAAALTLLAIGVLVVSRLTTERDAVEHPSADYRSLHESAWELTDPDQPH